MNTRKTQLNSTELNSTGTAVFSQF